MGANQTNIGCHCDLDPPSASSTATHYLLQSSCKVYPSQTKILDGRTSFCRPFRMRFRSTFQGCEYLIWAKKRWKVLRKRILTGLQKVRPAVQNLRLGSIKLLQKIVSNPEKPTHRITCCYYHLYHVAKVLQKIVASQKTNTSQKNQHIKEHDILLVSFVSCCKVYATQTKSLIGRVNISEVVFEALFKGCE